MPKYKFWYCRGMQLSSTLILMTSEFHGRGNGNVQSSVDVKDAPKIRIMIMKLHSLEGMRMDTHQLM